MTTPGLEWIVPALGSFCYLVWGIFTSMFDFTSTWTCQTCGTIREFRRSNVSSGYVQKSNKICGSQSLRHRKMCYNKIMCHPFQIQFFQFEELPSVLQTGPIKHPLRRRKRELRPGFNHEINRKLLWSCKQWRLQQGYWNSINFISVRHLIITRRPKNNTKDFFLLLPGFVNNRLY